jgi:hypothetical protein
MNRPLSAVVDDEPDLLQALISDAEISCAIGYLLSFGGAA